MTRFCFSVLVILFSVAPSLVAQQPHVTILRNVSIVGLSGAEDQTGRDIVIEAGKIRSIVTAGKANQKDAQVIDLTGRWVMPGLIDTRVRIAEKNVQWPQDEIEFRNLLAFGVTTVLDVGGRLETIQEIGKRSAEAGWVGPRVLHCGSALFGAALANRDSASQGFIPKNAKEAVGIVGQLKKSGATAIMLEHNLQTKIAKAAADAAQANGLLTLVEPGVMSFSEAAGCGADMVQSLGTFVTDFIGGGDREKLVKDRSTVFFYAWEKINPSRNGRQKIDKLTTLGTFFTPSLGKEFNFLDHYAPSARDAEVETLQKKYSDLMRIAHNSGVPLIAGSGYSTAENDRVTMVDELRAWVRAGMEARVALEAATKNAAFALRLAETVGQIDPGFVADMLVLDGNPALDLKYVADPVMVVRNGNVYKADELLTPEVRTRRNECAVRAVLERQQIAWNEKDLRRFMEGYWQDEQLLFASGGEVTHGWQTTLDRYIKNYNSAAKIGKLDFSIKEIDLMGDDWAKVLGAWEVARTNEKLSGLFTLIFQRQTDGWKIVHDHTSSASK
jgi:ketosteroid isomerase-like protein